MFRLGIKMPLYLKEYLFEEVVYWKGSIRGRVNKAGQRGRAERQHLEKNHRNKK